MAFLVFFTASAKARIVMDVAVTWDGIGVLLMGFCRSLLPENKMRLELANPCREPKETFCNKKSII